MRGLAALLLVVLSACATHVPRLEEVGDIDSKACYIGRVDTSQKLPNALSGALLFGVFAPLANNIGQPPPVVCNLTVRDVHRLAYAAAFHYNAPTSYRQTNTKQPIAVKANPGMMVDGCRRIGVTVERAKQKFYEVVEACAGEGGEPYIAKTVGASRLWQR